MVGTKSLCKSIHEILSQKEIDLILKKSLNETDWKLIKCCLKPATNGIAGFLGDHYRVTLQVEVAGVTREVLLFMKTIPKVNKPKADFINENNFFKRELVMFKLLDELLQYTIGSELWCANCYLFNDSFIVMPDMCKEGYTTRHYLENLDLPHVLATTKSIARFHASFTNYETQKTKLLQKNYDMLQDYGDVVKESNFMDSPWMRASAKLSANFLKVYSRKFNEIEDLEEKLLKQYLKGCESLRVYEDSLNTVIHKDLWMNNIMYKYDDTGNPINSLIIDFQCIRYGPPAFDVMIFLYLCTSRKFREENEETVFDHYYSVFFNSLDKSSKERVGKLGYNKAEFLKFCQAARMFGMLEAIAIGPYVFMDPESAQEIFDNPDTFDKYTNEDRTEPVLKYSKKNKEYAEKQLEVMEEFVERYVLNIL